MMTGIIIVMMGMFGEVGLFMKEDVQKGVVMLRRVLRKCCLMSVLESVLMVNVLM